MRSYPGQSIVARRGIVNTPNGWREYILGTITAINQPLFINHYLKGPPLHCEFWMTNSAMDRNWFVGAYLLMHNLPDNAAAGNKPAFWWNGTEIGIRTGSVALPLVFDYSNQAIGGITAGIWSVRARVIV